MKFRKKPVVIDAFQFDGSNADAIADWMGANRAYDPTAGYVYINTLEGRMRADKGDWIIKGVNGEFYPCKPDIFEKTYEPAEDHMEVLKETTDRMAREGLGIR